MTAPVIEISNSGYDHLRAQIITYTGCATTGEPWSDFAFGGNDTTSTTITFPAITAEADGQFIVGIVSRGVDSAANAWTSGYTNAGLTSITDDGAGGTTSGTGGGTGAYHGTKTTAGAVAATTATDAATSPHATLHIAIRGVAAPEARGAYEASGTLGSSTSSLAVAWPTHVADDIGFLIVETQWDETPTLTAGTVFDGNQIFSIATADTDNRGTRLTVWWGRATGASEPSVTIVDPGEHVIAIIDTLRGCRTTGNPYESFATSTVDAASTTITYPTVTTLFDGQLVYGIATHGQSSASAFSSGLTNAGLASLTEHTDASSTTGNGGGITTWTGTDTTAGATGTTTATDAGSRAHTQATFVIAAAEAQYDLEEISFLGYGADDSDSAAIWIPDAGGQYVIGLAGGTTPTVTTDGAGWRTINNVTVELSGLVVGSECYIYETATPTNIVMQVTADATTESVTFNYVTDTAISIDVRQSSFSPRYLPYKASGTITSTGFSLVVSQQLDPIAEPLALWSNFASGWDLAYMANNATGVSAITLWDNEGSNAEANADLAEITGTPVRSVDHFAVDYDGIDLDSLDAVKESTGLTTDLDTTTNGATVFWIGQIDTFATDALVRYEGTGGGNANRHALRTLSTGEFGVQVGTSGLANGTTQHSTGTTYLVIAYLDHTTDGAGWMEVNGVSEMTSTKAVVADLDQMGVPAVSGSASAQTCHAFGWMVGEASDVQKATLEQYAKQAGADI
jgi:hypothetical protein